MKLFEKLKNAKVDCTHLVRRNEDGSYDVTKVHTRGMIMGSVATFIGVIIGNIISHKIRK